MNTKLMGFLLCFCLAFLRLTPIPGNPSQDQDSSENIGPIIKLLKNGHRNIYLLGTIHFAHARNPNYSWPHLEYIFNLISPQLLLVEIRPQHLVPSEYLDGPIEMSFLVYLASQKQIKSKGIDWWLDEQIFDLSKVDWNRRNDQMIKQVLEAVNHSNANKILITVGAAHIEPFIISLVKRGYSEVQSPKFDYSPSDYKNIPEAIIEIWRQGVYYLSNLPYAHVERILKKRNSLKEIISHRGYLFDVCSIKKKSTSCLWIPTESTPRTPCAWYSLFSQCGCYLIWDVRWDKQAE